MVRDLMREPLTVQEFKEWLKTKDPDERYNYFSSYSCAFAQFLKAKGIKFEYVSGRRWVDDEGVKHSLPYPAEAFADVLAMSGGTFGLLLKETDRLLAAPLPALEFA